MNLKDSIDHLGKKLFELKEENERLRAMISSVPRSQDGKPIIPLVTHVFAWCEIGDSDEGPTPCAVVEGVICDGPDYNLKGEVVNGGWTVRGVGEWEGMEFSWQGLGTRSHWYASKAALEEWMQQNGEKGGDA